MVLDYLPASFRGDMVAREQMHYAQCLAGMAFSNALLGIVHSWRIKPEQLSPQDIFLTDVQMRFIYHMLSNITQKILLPQLATAEIARRMGLEGTSQKALINSLCEKIHAFNVALNIPKTLKEFGIDEEEFKRKIANIAELAVGDACTGSNPREITPEQMEKLFVCTYYGTEVDF